MKALALGQDKVKRALASYEGDRQYVLENIINDEGKSGWNHYPPGKAQGKIKLALDHCPEQFILHLLTVSDITVNQRITLLSYVQGTLEADWDTVLSSPADIHNFVLTLGANSINAMVQLAGRYYPVTIRSELHHYDIIGGNKKLCIARYAIIIGEHTRKNTHYWTSYDFEINDEPTVKTARDLFSEIKIVELDTEELELNAERVYQARLLSDSTGKVMTAKGQGFEVRKVQTPWGGGYYDEWDILSLGEDGTIAKVVIDKDLEVIREERSNPYWYRQKAQEEADPLPFVRVFNLVMKRWVYIDVRDLTEYEFDKTAIDKLVLPAKVKGAMKQLFEAETAALSGDLIAGKHGGMIILANGPTGTGKTLTAEVCAEHTRRPLYVMEMAELGVDVNQAEARLEKIFARVTRWNAVLLMDECDIFLQERKEDLTHNVMVGIFLRLMDYYHGLMFLTSNRGHVIDEAFASRITLRFDYKPLDRSAREKVWALLLEAADVNVSDRLDNVAEISLNGRQIRNLVRLIRVLHGKNATSEQLQQITEFAIITEKD